MILAGVSDRTAIEAFLQTHVATSMFPLSNLAHYGMAGGHPHAVTFWIRRDGATISDVLTISDEGMVFPQCHSGDWESAAAILRGRTVKGVIGEAAQVASLRRAIGLTAPAWLDDVEPSYALELRDMIMPKTKAMTVRPFSAVPFDTLTVWRAAYCVETLAMSTDRAVRAAENDIKRYAEKGTHRVLFDGDDPVAMTGFNSMLPEIVQIGGVYVPPKLRNRGYGRAAVALHLQEAVATGVTRSVLFAANPSAERAYQAIGFQRNGSFTLAIYEQPQVIR